MKLNKKYYILIDSLLLKPLIVEINAERYIFIVDDDYFRLKDKNLFSLKEKLFIMDMPISIAWRSVSRLTYYLMLLRYTIRSPTQLKINVVNKNIEVYIDN